MLTRSLQAGAERVPGLLAPQHLDQGLAEARG
jgi:hypothetical protein